MYTAPLISALVYFQKPVDFFQKCQTMYTINMLYGKHPNSIWKGTSPFGKVGQV